MLEKGVDSYKGTVSGNINIKGKIGGVEGEHY